MCSRVFGRSLNSGRLRFPLICLDSVRLRGLPGCRRGRACAAVSLAGLSGLASLDFCGFVQIRSGFVVVVREGVCAAVSLAGLPGLGFYGFV